MLLEFDIRESPKSLQETNSRKTPRRNFPHQAFPPPNEAASSGPACIRQALSEVRRTKGMAAMEFMPDPSVQTTSGGSRVVYLHQHVRGVPVFQSGCTVRFGVDGQIEEITDRTWHSKHFIEVSPSITAARTAQAMSAYIAANIHAGFPKRLRYKPRILASFPLPCRPTVLSRGPFANPIPAHLVIFPIRRGARLAWWLTVRLREQHGEYDLLVTADHPEPEILYCRSLLCSAQAVGTVFAPFPLPGGSRVESFPRPVANLPQFIRPLPPNFPFEWVDSDSLKGNCTFAFLGSTGEKTFRGSTTGGQLAFQPTSTNNDDQKLVNAFYYCNLMHDFFLALGFDEAAGNFQNTNRIGAGMGGDCLIARVLGVAVEGLATMRSRPDGKNCEMSLGPIVGSGRHTALDPDFLIHEFTHGVTERVVGGPMDFQSLDKPQSIALSEGWSDYFSLTFQSYGTIEKVVFGDWATNRPGGIRHAPYDNNFPKGFGDLGKPPYQKPAACGEIWCATLMRMNREIGNSLQDSRLGHVLGWQIVFDGLKIPSNPNFLQARNAIFLALDNLLANGMIPNATHALAAPAVRRAFAAYGMGPGAQANKTSLKGNVAG
jgi:extracellular elastinolytic metalloproteinase